MAKTNKDSQRGQTRGNGMTSYDGGPMVRHGRFPLSRLRSEFDRMFEDFFRGWPALMEERGSQWGFDVDDQADKILVRAEAPGFEAGEFDVELRDNQLVMCACQKEEANEEGSRRWQRREFYQSIPLPSGIDPEKIDAEYRNGVLMVTVPKTEASQAKRIPVK